MAMFGGDVRSVSGSSGPINPPDAERFGPAIGNDREVPLSNSVPAVCTSDPRVGQWPSATVPSHVDVDRLVHVVRVEGEHAPVPVPFHILPPHDG